MKNKIVPALSMLLACLAFDSCSVVGGIFKAGMGVGVIVVVAVIVVILFIIRRAGKK